MKQLLYTGLATLVAAASYAGVPESWRSDTAIALRQCASHGADTQVFYRPGFEPQSARAQIKLMTRTLEDPKQPGIEYRFDTTRTDRTQEGRTITELEQMTANFWLIKKGEVIGYFGIGTGPTALATHDRWVQNYEHLSQMFLRSGERYIGIDFRVGMVFAASLNTAGEHGPVPEDFQIRGEPTPLSSELLSTAEHVFDRELFGAWKTLKANDFCSPLTPAHDDYGRAIEKIDREEFIAQLEQSLNAAQ